MRHYLLIPLLFLGCTLFGQTPNKDTTNNFKKLNIVLMSGSSIVLQDGIINTDESKSFMTFYDDNGKPIEERIANIKDRSGIIYKYQYDTKCNGFQKWEWLKFNGNNIDTVQIQQITFDNNCKMKKIVWTDSTGSVSDVRHLEFDNKGRQLKEVDKDRKGKMTAFVFYSYPDSFTIDKKGFFGDSTFWYHSQEHFDNRGNIINSVSFDEKGSKSIDDEKTDYIYSGDKLTEEITYNAEGKTTAKTSYSYNNDNLVDRIISKTMDGDREAITIYKYRKKK